MSQTENPAKQEIFLSLYSAYYTEFYRYAYYFTGNAEDAEDAVSDAVVNAFRYFDGLRDHGKFKFWFLRILKNACKTRCAQYRQSGAVSVEENEEALSVPADTPDPDETAALRRELDALKPEDRTIVVMAVQYGYTSEEIGKFLGMTSGNVRVRLHRTLGLLRKKLS